MGCAAAVMCPVRDQHGWLISSVWLKQPFVSYCCFVSQPDNSWSVLHAAVGDISSWQT